MSVRVGRASRMRRLFLEPASVVKVEYRGKGARFRVVWVGGGVGGEVGLLSLEPHRCIWGKPLPGASAAVAGGLMTALYICFGYACSCGERVTVVGRAVALAVFWVIAGTMLRASAGRCAPATSCPSLRCAIRNMEVGWEDTVGSWNEHSHGSLSFAAYACGTRNGRISTRRSSPSAAL